MRTMTRMAPEVCSCSALRQAARHVTRLYDAALAPVGLGLNQYSVLAKLDRFGPKPVQDLATILVMDRSTLGHLLRPLERRGLVTLDADEHDRRSRLVALTPAGAALIRKARHLWVRAEHRFERAFGSDATLDLRTILRRVTETKLSEPH